VKQTINRYVMITFTAQTTPKQQTAALLKISIALALKKTHKKFKKTIKKTENIKHTNTNRHW